MPPPVLEPPTRAAETYCAHQQAREDIVSSSVSKGKEESMKVDLKLPGLGELHYENGPMSSERFGAICVLVGLAITGFFVVEFFRLVM